ncbi:hypothetical protein SLEP1_g19100 [Rubroshorea leprosula]|nr:hypothetical protein SLEP1_g19100 [Rubroshorea leprosula]
MGLQHSDQCLRLIFIFFASLNATTSAVTLKASKSNLKKTDILIYPSHFGPILYSICALAVFCFAAYRKMSNSSAPPSPESPQLLL